MCLKKFADLKQLPQIPFINTAQRLPYNFIKNGVF